MSDFVGGYEREREANRFLRDEMEVLKSRLTVAESDVERLRNVADILRIACEGIMERSQFSDPIHAEHVLVKDLAHIAHGALIAAEAMR